MLKYMKANTMILCMIMVLLLSRTNLDLHSGKKPCKKSSEASLQVIKNPRPQRVEVEQGRPDMWREGEDGEN